MFSVDNMSDQITVGFVLLLFALVIFLCGMYFMSMFLPCRMICSCKGLILQKRCTKHDGGIGNLNLETHELTSSTEMLLGTYDVIPSYFIQTKVKLSKCCICLTPAGKEAEYVNCMYLPNAKRAMYGEARRTVFFNQLKTFISCLPQGAINETCPICLEYFMPGRDIILLKCSHGYHESCLIQWIRIKASNTTYSAGCPLCKDSLNEDNLSLNYGRIYPTPLRRYYGSILLSRGPHSELH
ncbi:uncharacterized protein LOC130647570 isoform X1 [Hydractinia symbiolongicarpus]|uniref:uncharacterized protein LOC130647570 isoform X1 n=2 Tax=Hydractinia symbiolongicarpus TaxID=13093 RepID=UPI002550D361|nr:uncharacterized protein LOC130647570 isoform X1 [Hydractinia symbiolongicarpus]